MSEVETFPAPDLFLNNPAETGWERDRWAFHEALPSLFATHNGVYVAFYGGRLVAEGTDELEVARRVYESIGYVPIYVGLVSDRPVTPARMPRYRVWRPGEGGRTP